MTSQTTALACVLSMCNPEDLFLALAHIENKLARAWLHEFDGEKKNSH